MPIEVDEDNLKAGLLGLIIALVELIQEVIEHQALKRIESDKLTEKEMERLGNALMELDDAIAKIKKDNNIGKVVREVRKELDKTVDEGMLKMRDPRRWTDAVEEGGDLLDS